MKTSTFKPLMLAFFALMSISANAQSYYNYDYPWTFGLNGGAAWQYSDVSPRLGGGFGLDLSKRLIGRQNNWLAFDARGRLLFAQQNGQSYERTYDLEKFSVLSDYSTANGSLGYAFHNNQTRMGELDLEGVFTLNRLRERTGWSVQFFGGIGLGLFNTMTDQTDDFGNLYAYNTIDTTQSRGRIRRDVRALRDGIYEAPASGFENTIKAAIMPSLGIGVGYQLTPRFAIGLEHKATWTSSDAMDGVLDATSNRPNDVHHYSSLYLRWTLRGNQEPEIDVKSPNVSPYTLNTPSGSIRADIRRVQNRNGVSCSLNGLPIDYFDFNTATEEFYLTVPLVRGTNTVVIRAQNSFGTTEETVTFVYEPFNNPAPTPNPQPTPNNPIEPPTVNFTVPAQNGFNTDNSSINVEAQVRNVQSQNDIKFTVNGYANRNFSYNNGRVTATVPLQEGNNIVEVSGSNGRGEVRDSRTIVYTAPRIVVPTIRFTQPNSSPTNVEVATYNLRAVIENVTNSNEVQFRFNGKTQIFTLKNKDFSANLSLIEGANVAEIVATTAGGTASESVTIIFKQKSTPTPTPPTPPTPTTPAPTVSITSPKGSPHNANEAEITIYAALTNVSNKNEIKFLVNNKSQPFNFSNGKFNATVTLIEGNNNVEIQATTNGGTAKDAVAIVYKKPAPPTVTPPKVTITAPATNPFLANTNTAVVTAVVTNVSSKNDITFTLNGQSFSNFTYSSGSNLVKATVSLVQGSNVFEIAASNGGGTDKAGGQIVYKPQTPVQKPVITLVTPAKSPYVSNKPFMDVKVRVQYVNGKSDITATADGSARPDFTFVNEILTLNMDINPNGGSTLVITATNQDGSATETIRLTYQVPTVPKPTITLINPKSSPFTSSSASFDLQAAIANVGSQNDINLTVNGKQVTNFVFANNTLNYPMTLQEGSTNVSITANNAGGNATQALVLNYTRPKQLPVVKITAPKSSPFVSALPRIDLRATVQHVGKKEDITLKINTVEIKDFAFANNNLQYTAELKEGENIIEITASNADGKDTKKVTVSYTAPVAKPIMTLRYPVKDVVNTEKDAESVSVIIANIKGKNDITMTLNGKPFTAFNFDEKVNLLTANVTLIAGKNTVVITAQNGGGKATQTIVFNYQVANKPTEVPKENPQTEKPTIVFVSPSKPDETVSEAQYIVRATVKGASRKDIKVTLNGKELETFTLDESGILTATVTLNAGKNTVVVIAKSSAGVSRQTGTINFNNAQMNKRKGEK